MLSINEKEKRRKKINDGISISMLDAPEPSAEAKVLYEKYINGDIEIEQLRENIKEKYRALGENQ